MITNVEQAIEYGRREYRRRLDELGIPSEDRASLEVDKLVSLFTSAEDMDRQWKSRSGELYEYVMQWQRHPDGRVAGVLLALLRGDVVLADQAAGE